MKMMCEKLCIESMCFENVISSLVYAETYNASNLKEYALKWISWDTFYIKNCKEYEDLLKDTSNLESRNLLKEVQEAFVDDRSDDG